MPARPPVRPGRDPGIGRRLLAGLGGALLLLLATACVQPPLPPRTDCLLDSECPSGRCLAGMCVDPVADVAPADTPGGEIGPNDGVGASDVDAAPVKCEQDLDCSAVLASLDPCLLPRCINGVCGVAFRTPESSCLTPGPCPTSGACSTAGACVPLPGAKPCDDGNPCTVDFCNVFCQNTTLEDDAPCIGDGLPCTVETCVAGDCQAKVLAGNCVIDGQCRAKGEVDPGDPCARCLPEQNPSVFTPVTSGACNDGDACTTAETCHPSGLCLGEPVTCKDDDNPCTEPVCDNLQGCVQLPAAATCTDGDPCTVGDVCVEKNCQSGQAMSCDDANPCTQDQCDPGLGCIHTPVSLACLADTDPCTEDVCIGGSCVGVQMVSVCKIGGTCVPAGAKSDGNPCLVCDTAKDPNGWTLLDGTLCSDGDACTFFDSCISGQCFGEPGVCDDKNPCTKNTCTPEQGCVFLAAPAPCDDLNNCTADDQCLKGKCVGTAVTAETCADANPCTDDACSPAVGCTHTPSAAPCNDGDPCTKGDTCNAGKCVAGGVVCPCEFDADCGDGNPCTADACTPGKGCANVIIGPGGACDDGNACTTQDACTTGFCQGSPITCDDKNPCTEDGCVADTGCTAVAMQGVTCDDGNACTNGDLCLNGACGGTPKNCDDGNPCTLDGCNAKSGVCSHVDAQLGTACPDDGIPCTVDQCVLGECNHKAVAPATCLIKGACLSGGALHPFEPCLGCLPLVTPYDWSPRTGLPCNDGNACTQGDLCQANVQCGGAPLQCEDDNPCTLNGCNPLASGQPCLFVPTTAPCNDGNACTGGDACIGGTCLGTPTVCDDANPCTLDVCDAKLGCLAKAVDNGTACPDDTLACTADLCLSGTCIHPVDGQHCVIGNACVPSATPAPGQPCHACIPQQDPGGWSPSTGEACDDGNLCTISDACKQGACAGTTIGACDDGNPCTADACSLQAGCSHSPVGGACDDGNACTVNDVCSNGACGAGKPKLCAAPASANSCLASTCDPAVGCVTISACGPLHSCQSGLCLTVDALGGPGPAKLPFDPVAVPQPLVPTLRWQETHTGPKGAIPQLWLATQTRACAPAVGVYSDVVLAVLPPGEAEPTLVPLPTPGPAGSPGWCAVHPQLLAHPATFNHLTLAWLEGGNLASPCGIDSNGGQIRLGLVGLGGKELALAPAAPCPSGSALPLDLRPALHLLAAAGGAPDKPQDLAGHLVRAGAQGALAWTGPWQSGWGGAGKPMPQGTVTDATWAPQVSRPARADIGAGAVFLQPARYLKSGQQQVAGLDATPVTSDGSLAGAAKPLLTGIDLTGNGAQYRAVEGVWDPDASRLGLVVSGTITQGGADKGFLAMARATAEQTVPAKPSVVQLFEPTDSGNGPTLVHAFRLAEVPGSPDFLLLWSAPGASTLHLARLQPIDDTQFLVKSIATVATNFVGHGEGEPVPSSGGLSELVIDPQAERFSVAYEGLGALYLLTAPLPK